MTTTQSAHPGSDRPEQVDEQREQPRRHERHGTPGHGVEAESHAFFSLAGHPQQQRPRRRLRRPDEQAEQQPGGPESARTGQRHHRQPGRDDAGQRSDDDRLGADPVVQETAEHRAQRGYHAGGHPEDQHIVRRDPVGVDTEHAAEGEHAGQAVPEDRRGQQVIDQVAIAVPLPDQVLPEPAVAAQHALGCANGLRRCRCRQPVRGQQQRSREQSPTSRPPPASRSGRSCRHRPAGAGIRGWGLCRRCSRSRRAATGRRCRRKPPPGRSRRSARSSAGSRADAASRCTERWPDRRTPHRPRAAPGPPTGIRGARGSGSSR